jgi:hypothetical protein
MDTQCVDMLGRRSASSLTCRIADVAVGSPPSPSVCHLPPRTRALGWAAVSPALERGILSRGHSLRFDRRLLFASIGVYSLYCTKPSENRRTADFPTDSTTLYQALTTNQNRRTPIFDDFRIARISISLGVLGLSSRALSPSLALSTLNLQPSRGAYNPAPKKGDILKCAIIMPES